MKRASSIQALALGVLLTSACRREDPPKPTASIGLEKRASPAAPQSAGSRPSQTDLPNPDELVRLGCVRVSLLAPANGSVERAIEVDRNSRIFGQVMLGGQGAQYALVGTSGSELPLRNLGSASTGGGGSMEVFEADDPPLGSLTVRLTGGASGGVLDLVLFFENGRKLIVQAEPSQVSLGGRVTITARIVDSDRAVLRGDLDAFEGTVRIGDGQAWKLEFADDGEHADGAAGDGIQGAFFDRTALAGRAEVLVRGDLRFAGYRTVRDGLQQFSVMPTGASFANEMSERPVDENEDGLYEVLEFTQEVSFTSNGSYILTGDLLDAQKELITITRWGVEITQGSAIRIAKLSVSGSDLVRHGVEGPWTLSDLRLVREDLGSLRVAQRPNHVTAIVPLSKFQPPAPPTFGRLKPDRAGAEGGQWINLLGSGLDDIESVFVDGKEAQIQGGTDAAVRVCIPRTTRERPAGDQASVDVEVRTRWGRALGHDALRYVW